MLLFCVAAFVLRLGPLANADALLLKGRVPAWNEFLAHPMSVEAAVMQMDLMNNDFYVFTNSTSMEMNVLYRRRDATFGLIEASAAAKKSLVNGAA